MIKQFDPTVSIDIGFIKEDFIEALRLYLEYIKRQEYMEQNEHTDLFDTRTAYLGFSDGWVAGALFMHSKMKQHNE